jgi:DNA repair protein RadA/Sms
VRAVAHAGVRLKEAAKLGFATAFAPASLRADGEGVKIAVDPISSVATLIARIAGRAVETKPGRAGIPAVR